MIEKIRSEDGIEYNVIKTPGVIKIKTESFNSHDDFTDNYTIHHVYTKCECIRNKKLPLDANPREPTRADVVNAMIQTLTKTPQFFHHWNNGISIIIDNINYNTQTKDCEIRFKPGEGICNGGHTYFAIETMSNQIDDKALVHLELIQLPPDFKDQKRLETIIKIAAARNRNRQLRESTQADYLNFYDPFKKELGEFTKYVSWHEGQSDIVPGSTIKSEHFIRLLAILDPHWYHHPVYNPGGGLHNAAQGTKKIHNKWYDSADEGDPDLNLYNMGVLSKDLFKIRDMIAYSLLNDDFSSVYKVWRRTAFYKWLKGGKGRAKTRKLNFYKNGSKGLGIPETAEVIIIGLFRNNIWLGKDKNGKTEYIGWLMEPTNLWRKTKIEIYKHLSEAFDDANRDPIAYKKKKDPYKFQLINILFGMKLPRDPEVFYRVFDGKKYQKEQNKPNFYIEYIPKPPLMELKEVQDKLPDDTMGYVDK